MSEAPFSNDPLLARHPHGPLFQEDATGRFVATDDWRLVHCNLALGQLLGYPENVPPVGRTLSDFSPDAVVLHKLQTVVRVEGRAGPAALRLRRADGELVDVECRVWAWSDGLTPTQVHGQIVEVSGSRRLKMRLQGAERMELIGRLAGGLAHDFNNLLTVISGNGDKLSLGLPADDPLRPAAAAIQQAAARASSLTRQLLAFSRQQVFELQAVGLHTLVANARPILAEILGERVELRLSTSTVVPDIRADRRQLEQVLASLAMNAREAIAATGVVTITVDAMEVVEPAPKEREWLRSGRYVRLVVTDSGRGMDAVTKAYAFQPFFTTKPIGDGRGLGLATVYGIVKQSHGFVWVESEPGMGATFTLIFPVVDAPAGDGAPVRPGGGSETVLIVERDEGLRRLMCDTLRRRGYHVLDAPTAADALTVFGSVASRVHLVIAEIAADTPEGDPLATALRRIDGRVQALVTLEPADPDDGPQRRLLPTTPSIQKPFTLQMLANTVREILDSGEGRG